MTDRPTVSTLHRPNALASAKPAETVEKQIGENWPPQSARVRPVPVELRDYGIIGRRSALMPNGLGGTVGGVLANAAAELKTAGVVVEQCLYDPVLGIIQLTLHTDKEIELLC